MAKKKMSEVLFERYAHLANQYAKSIWDLHKIQMEFDDLVQELHIKMYSAIISYGKKWAEYLETGKYKPINLEIYLRNVLINRSRDFIKKIEKSPLRQISIENSNRFDVGAGEGYSISLSDIKSGKCEIGGVDVFEGLDKSQARVFQLWVLGYDLRQLSQLYPNAEEIVNSQIENLRKRKDEIFEAIGDSKQYFVQYATGE